MPTSLYSGFGLWRAGESSEANNARTRLTENTTYYVATTGSDETGDGTDSAPWVTIQHALNWISANIDCGGQEVGITVMPGTYSGFYLPNMTGITSTTGGLFTIAGYTDDPADVVINGGGAACITTEEPTSPYYIEGFTLTSPGGTCVYANNGAITLGTVDFGAADVHMLAQYNGSITIEDDYSIGSGAAYHLLASYGGFINASAVECTLTGTPAFSSSFARATQNGTIRATGVTYTGSASGTRYNAGTGGGIYTSGGGANYFPGDVAGTETSPGWYA